MVRVRVRVGVRVRVSVGVRLLHHDLREDEHEVEDGDRGGGHLVTLEPLARAAAVSYTHLTLPTIYSV